jgi:hypothetical protein
LPRCSETILASDTVGRLTQYERVVLEPYLRDVMGDPGRHVEGLGLQIVDLPKSFDSTDDEYFDSESLVDLRRAFVWERELAAERDARSVTYVIRQRKSRVTRDSRVGYIFLTDNMALTDIARRYCIEQKIIGPADIGPAIHPRQLAAMLWLALGSNDKRDISRRDLIQRCTEVVRTNPDVIRRTRNMINSFRPETAEQMEALLSRPRPTQMLMDLTLSTPNVITSTNIDEIFERVRLAAAAEVEARAK